MVTRSELRKVPLDGIGRHDEIESRKLGNFLTRFKGRICRRNEACKQTALRGRAQLDEHGVCGHQKLVTSADRTCLLANFDRLYPGAKLTIVDAKADQKTKAQALLSLCCPQHEMDQSPDAHALATNHSASLC